MTTVSVLVPIAIVDAMLTSASIAEPASGETAWVAATVYKVGDVVIRSTTHQVYECVKDMSSARSTLPENDPTYWLAMRPTMRWAAFDGVTSTQSKDTASLSYTVQPGFFNAICLYGLLGSTLTVTIKDQPGGTIVFGPATYNIQLTPFEEYDYCWGQIMQLDRLVVSGLTPYPSAEATIAVAAGAGEPVAIGTLAFGDLASLVPQDSTWAGPNYGAQAQPTTFSAIKVLDDGTVQITRRRSSTDLSMDLQVPKGGGDIALRLIQRVLDVPACWVGTDAAGYDGLNTYGLASGRVTYEDGREMVHIDVKGLA
jgi:hypothetical protein